MNLDRLQSIVNIAEKKLSDLNPCPSCKDKRVRIEFDSEDNRFTIHCFFCGEIEEIFLKGLLSGLVTDWWNKGGSGVWDDN